MRPAKSHPWRGGGKLVRHPTVGTSAQRAKWRAQGINVETVTSERPSICEICGSDGGPKGIALDHVHETGEFRGWLCGRCNTAIGSLADSIPLLERAVEYLKRHLGAPEWGHGIGPSHRHTEQGQ